MENQEPDFKSLLDSRMKERGLNLRKLSELSGIHIAHLENLVRGNFERLPAAPYLRGYLERLGRVLDFDPTAWWDHVKRETVMKSSGPSDTLPVNRFTPRPLARYGWAFAVALILLLYFGLRSSNILGKPGLTIQNPPAATVTVSDLSFTLKGNAANATDLTINGEPIPLEPGGEWAKTVTLQPGPNPFEFTAKKFLGGETKIVRQLIYEPAASTSPPTPNP